MFIAFAKRHVQSSDSLLTFKFTQLLFLADRDITYVLFVLLLKNLLRSRHR